MHETFSNLVILIIVQQPSTLVFFAARYQFKNRDPFRTISHNLNRVAAVWMDHHRDVYQLVGHRFEAVPEYGDVSDRLELRRTLKCKSFAWCVLFDSFRCNGVLVLIHSCFCSGLLVSILIVHDNCKIVPHVNVGYDSAGQSVFCIFIGRHFEGILKLILT